MRLTSSCCRRKTPTKANEQYMSVASVSSEASGIGSRPSSISEISVASSCMAPAGAASSTGAVPAIADKTDLHVGGHQHQNGTGYTRRASRHKPAHSLLQEL
jgi:hypothetical protein